MKADKAATALHLRVELLEMGSRGMSATSIGVDNDGIGFVNGCVIGPVSVEGELSDDKVRGVIVEAFCEELNPGVVLVLTRVVAGFSSNEQDVAFGVSGVGVGKEGGEAKESEGGEFEHSLSY